MPSYTFRNKLTGEVVEKFFSISSRDEFVKENPDYETVIDTAPMLGDSVRLGIRKPDDGFREVLSRIAKSNYKSNLSDKLSRK